MTIVNRSDIGSETLYLETDRSGGKTLKRCTEGYILFVEWYKAFNSGAVDAQKKRKAYDDHLKKCENCNSVIKGA